MTYDEERLAVSEALLDVSMLGFDALVKSFVNEGATELEALLEPYVSAIKELKSSIEYTRKEIDKNVCKQID